MNRRKSLRQSISNIFKGTEDTHNWGPLLITIGPNCCGKTTFVKSLDEDVTEFSTENVPELHEKVPVEIACKVWQDKISGDVVQTLRGQTVYNVPMLERLKKMRGLELTLVALLFAKLIPLKDFEEKLEPLLADSDYGDVFLGSVRELYQTRGTVLAIDFATTETAAALKAAIKTNEGVICWGNTNLNPDFYKDALKVADKYQRIVRFVRWGREIPVVPLKELFRRSILRFLETGRYVSSAKLDKFRKHADFFLSKATGNTHIEYASLAEYDMDDIGCVTHKINPVLKKSPYRTVENKYVVWTNTGMVFNIANGPPLSPSAINISQSMSRSTSNNNGGVPFVASSDTEGEGKERSASPRAVQRDGKKSPSVTGSNASATGISFSTAATKNMNKIPSDPNLLPLSASNLQAVAAAAAAASSSTSLSESKESDSALQPSDVNTSSQREDGGIAFSSGRQSEDASPVVLPSQGASKHQPPAKLSQENSTSSVSSPVPVEPSSASGSASQKDPSTSKPPTAPPTPSRAAATGPVRQSSNGAASGVTASPAAASPTKQSSGGGFSLLGMLGLSSKDRESPASVDPHTAKFVIDESTPTTGPHPHNADHSVLLQDSVKLTHIHQREASLHLNKEKSVGNAAEFRKSNSQGAEAIALPAASAVQFEEPSALSPAVFVVDEDSPRPGAEHQPTVNHRVHLQDSVKLAHIQEAEKQLHPIPDEGPLGHPKDHVKHPVFITPPPAAAHESSEGEEECGFSSSKSANFVLDDHSPRLTHQKTEEGDVLLQDSVKLTHIHKNAVHDKPLFNPVIVRNDSFSLSEQQQKSAEKKISRTRSSSPPTRKLSFRASLVEEIPTDSEANSPVAPTDSKSTPRSAASSLFASVDGPAQQPAAATFILDENPSLHKQPSLNHEVHLQDSVKLAHIHHEKHSEDEHHAPIHVVKIELTPEQNAHQTDKHITFDEHSPAVVVRSPDVSAPPSAANSPKAAEGSSSNGNSSRGGSSVAHSSGKVTPAKGQQEVESSEDDDEGLIETLTPPTPKKSKDENPFTCVFPNLFCV